MAAHIPYELMEVGNKATKIDSHLIPQPDQAASDYRHNGGRITDPQDSSNDPLFNDPIKKDIRFNSFTKRFPSFEVIFYNTVNENPSIFVEALAYYITLTFRLYNS